jgi:hypothetical protein
MGSNVGKLSGITVLTITMGILLSTTLSCAMLVDANPLTEITLKLQPESPEVDVSPGNSGIVTATGTVTCEKWGPDQVKVSLIANCTHGDASVIPPNFVFGGSGGSEETRSFSVTTRLPIGTSSSETPTLTVSGNYVQGGMVYVIEPVSIDIIVLQYYYVNTYFNKGGRSSANYTAKYGESVNVDFIVHNAGNGKDKFEVDFDKRDEWEQDGFALPDPIDITLKEKRNYSVSWTIKTPEDKYRYNLIKMVVYSLGSRENGGQVKYISVILIRLEEHTISDRLGAILSSPLVILVMIIVSLVMIVVWYRRRG